MSAAVMAQSAFDVCNGDADGLCAIRQLRLAEPRPSALVTGLKREIGLLGRVLDTLQAKTPPGASNVVIDVCDVSLERNRPALLALLDRGAHIRYFDHHDAGDIPQHPALETHIELSPTMCTSAIVDAWLGGRFRAWAIAGAYGDNLAPTAERLADSLALDARARNTLRTVGEAINYNAYGESDADVLLHPAALYTVLAAHCDPLDLAQAAPIQALVAQRDADLAQARTIAVRSLGAADLIILPDAAWSRRVSGSFAHWIATREPARAHAVLRPNRDGTFNVSLRAPLASPYGANTLCRRFSAGDAGGGRAGAAGIDRLAPDRLSDFEQALANAVWTSDDRRRPPP